jgi:hypothetical protein
MARSLTVAAAQLGPSSPTADRGCTSDSSSKKLVLLRCQHSEAETTEPENRGTGESESYKQALSVSPLLRFPGSSPYTGQSSCR